MVSEPRNHFTTSGNDQNHWLEEIRVEEPFSQLEHAGIQLGSNQRWDAPKTDVTILHVYIALENSPVSFAHHLTCIFCEVAKCEGSNYSNP